MNKHFEDARYYLGRAVETATKGIREEIEPIENRFKEMTGKEEEPESGRLEGMQEELGGLEARAEGEAREAIGKAREQISSYRNAE